MKEFLSTNQISFLYLDITENMLNLKKFLAYRDTCKEFEPIRAQNRVGLPCLIIKEEDSEKIMFELPALEDLTD